MQGSKARARATPQPKAPTKPEHGQSAMCPSLVAAANQLYKLSVYAESSGLQQKASGALPAVHVLYQQEAQCGSRRLRSAPYIEDDPSLVLQVRELCEACGRISFVTFVAK